MLSVPVVVKSKAVFAMPCTPVVSALCVETAESAYVLVATVESISIVIVPFASSYVLSSPVPASNAASTVSTTASDPTSACQFEFVEAGDAVRTYDCPLSV